MHSRKKGKAGSKKPMKKKTLTWVRYKGKEVEMLILKLAKEGKSPSQIGLYLRDTYGIPDVRKLLGKKINKVLKERNLAAKIPEDLMALIEKAVQIRKHLEANKKDEPAKRGLTLTESKIKRLVKHYKETRALPEDWKYDAKSLAMY